MVNNITEVDWQETFRSLVTLAVEGFKFCALANGGAAVAILAYLGDIAGKSGPLPDMTCAMASFLLGLVFCGCAMIFAYLTQLNRLNLLADGKGTRGDWRLAVALLFISLSVLCFGIGSLLAVTSFR
jgi:hypothetical protein